ncbi:histone deacetylase 8-like [Haliotis rubra]|uniref:histone deacetylase 8-like n=1 Tax=Haliotis rubra TaxID=36100 RepID=UPI001EE5E18C|nr:histone deacetylase 8-like [Haliotis rubra]XP_046578894.1 histone deacetylase 8-like [Haliotis rubra]XP_046578895.1 histone deacetylase 8-like [Haliotis rubra]
MEFHKRMRRKGKDVQLKVIIAQTWLRQCLLQKRLHLLIQHKGSNSIDIYDIDNDDSQNSVDLRRNYCYDIVSVKQNDSLNENPDSTEHPSKKRRLCDIVIDVSSQTSPLSLTDVKEKCSVFSEGELSQGQDCASLITTSEDRGNDVKSEILHPLKSLPDVCDRDNDENKPEPPTERHAGADFVHCKDQEHQGHLGNSQSNIRLQVDVSNIDGCEGGGLTNQTSKVLDVNNCDKMYANKDNSETQDISNNVDVYEITDFDEHSQSPTPLHKRKRVLQARNEDVRKPNSPSKMKDSVCDDSMDSVTVGSVPAPRSSGQSRIGYVYSETFLNICDKMPRVEQRASMVHRLIEAYGLVKYMKVIPPREATASELLQFHSPEYVQFLEKISDQEDEEKYDQEAEQFGLTYDCPVHVGVYEYAVLVAGATVCAAELLVDGSCDIAMNWCGGWHHAKRDSASGFCYINDIVLGILKLRQRFDRVLYVDIDLHHGDGVEDAFCTTSKVLTVSFHKYLSGFFPGTGSLSDVGIGKGKYYSVNVPLLDGIKDTEFSALFNRVMTKVKEKFRPEAVVCQCGADGIAGDPMESFNLTPLGLGRCVYILQSWKIPLLLLGGGGYNHVNTAKCWAFLTSLAIGKKLPQDVPDHKFFMKYGPDYDLSVSAGNRRDNNSRDYLSKVYRQVMENLNLITS